MTKKEKSNWEKLSENRVDSRGFNYDLDSIMHYPRYYGSLGRKLPVLVPKKANAEMGQREELSSGDIAQTKAMYKCNGTFCQF